MRENKGLKKLSKPVKIGLIAGMVLLLAGVSAAYAVSGGSNGAAGTAATTWIGENHGVVTAPQTSTSTAGSGDIGVEKAKSIALSQVSGASANNIVKAHRDWDDGRLEYDVEIHYNGYEYEWEIDGTSGAILSSDTDRIDGAYDDDYLDDYDDCDDAYDDDRYEYDHDDRDYD